MKTSWGARSRVAALFTVLLVVSQSGIALAHQDPPGCESTGVSISLTLYRADGVTAVGGGTVEDGESVVYQTSLARPVGACSFEGGAITIDPAGPTGPIDVTPNGGVPCIGPTAPCVTSIDSKPLSYVVDFADQTTSAAGLRRVTAAAAYGGGVIHDGDPDGEGPTGTTTRTTVVAHPDLHVTKTPDGASINAGEMATFSIVVKNSGLGKAHDVVLVDDLPDNGGLTWTENPDTAECSIAGDRLKCTIGTLAAGESFSVTVDAPTTEANAGKLNNSASVTTSSHETHGKLDGSGDNSDLGDITVNAPGLSVTKTADATPVSDGTPIGFAITVTNLGPGIAKNATLSDPLPAGDGVSWSIDPAYAGPGTCAITGAPQSLDCSFGDLGVGAIAELHISSPTTDNSAGLYANTATADADNSPPVSAEASITVLAPGLAITKSADETPVSAGEDIGFSIGVSNAGPGTATTVTLVDPLPAGSGVDWSISPAYYGPGSCSIAGSAPTQTLSCSFGDLASGSKTSVHLTSATARGSDGRYPNTATADATNSPAKVAAATIEVLKPVLAITKLADEAVVSSGDEIGFTVSVTSVGPGKAISATLNDPLPGGPGVSWSISPAYAGPGTCSITSVGSAQTLVCAFGTLASGTSLSIHISSGTVDGSDGRYDNTASADAANASPVQASASIIVQKPGLGIVKTADRLSVSTDEKIGFTIAIANAGPGIARAVTVNDPLPGGNGVDWSIDPAFAGPGSCEITGAAPLQTLSCSLGDMAVGGLVSLHVSSATTDDSAKTYNNTATADATNQPPVSASARIVVLAPDLSITKTPDATPVSTTQAIGFTVAVSNLGLGKAFNVSISDPLPGGNGLGWSISLPYAGPGTCAISGSAPSQTLSCSLGTLLPSEGVLVHVTSGTTRASAGTYLNTATSDATNQAPVSAKASVTVLAPNLGITKAADNAQVSAGEPVGFTVTVTNRGPGTAFGVHVVDPLPGNADFDWSVVGYGGPGTCGITGAIPSQTLSCDLGNLGSGASVTIHVRTLTTHVCDGVYENTATVDAVNDGPASASATFEILHAGLTLATLPDDPQVRGGSQIGYTSTVHNDGPGTVFSVVLNQALPRGADVAWVLAPVYAGPGTCTIKGVAPTQNLSCAFGDLAGETTVSVHVQSTTTAASKGLYNSTATTRGQNNQIETATASILVLGVPKTVLGVEGCPSTVAPGGTLSLTLKGSNIGNADATGTVLRVKLPVGLDVADANDGDVSANGRQVDYDLSTLNVGKTVTRHLAVKVSANSGAVLPVVVELRTNEISALSLRETVSVSLAGTHTHGGALAEQPKYFGNLLEASPVPEEETTATSPGKAKHTEHDGINMWTNTQGPVAQRLYHAESTSQVEQLSARSHAIAFVHDVDILYGAIQAQTIRGESTSIASVDGASSTSEGSYFENLRINGQTVATMPPPNATYQVVSPTDPSLLIARVVLNEVSQTTSKTISGSSTSHSVAMIHVTLLRSIMGMPAGFELIIGRARTDATFPTFGEAPCFSGSTHA